MFLGATSTKDTAWAVTSVGKERNRTFWPMQVDVTSLLGGVSERRMTVGLCCREQTINIPVDFSLLARFLLVWPDPVVVVLSNGSGWSGRPWLPFLLMSLVESSVEQSVGLFENKDAVVHGLLFLS